jgi:hypothetical protein
MLCLTSALFATEYDGCRHGQAGVFDFLSTTAIDLLTQVSPGHRPNIRELSEHLQEKSFPNALAIHRYSALI